MDSRADIFSTGVLLYEMLTGRQPFPADTISDQIVAILGQEPDWEALPRQTPPKIRALLQRCLEKDSARRVRDIGEARIDIENATGATPAASSRSRSPNARPSGGPVSIRTSAAPAFPNRLASRFAFRLRAAASAVASSPEPGAAVGCRIRTITGCTRRL